MSEKGKNQNVKLEFEILLKEIDQTHPGTHRVRKAPALLLGWTTIKNARRPQDLSDYFQWQATSY